MHLTIINEKIGHEFGREQVKEYRKVFRDDRGNGVLITSKRKEKPLELGVEHKKKSRLVGIV